MHFSRKQTENRGKKPYAKRGLAIFYCILLLLISFCLPILGGREQKEQPQESGSANIGSTNIGRILNFGFFEQDGIERNGPELLRWKVIDAEEDRLLLLSETALDCVRYHDSYEKVGWKDSGIYTYLNETFYNSAFSQEQQEQILPTENGSIFLMNKDEFCKYYATYRTDQSGNDGFERDLTPLRQEDGCLFSEYALKKSAFLAKKFTGPWMLRTDEASYFVKYVDSGWKILLDDITADSIGIRPLMWVKKEVGYGMMVELSSARGTLYNGDTLSLEPGELFLVMDNKKEPMDIGELKNNAYELRDYGTVTLVAETEKMHCNFTVVVEPRAISMITLKNIKKTFHVGDVLTQKDLSSLYYNRFILADGSYAQVTEGAELLSGNTIEEGQVSLWFSYRRLKFEVPITVLPAEETSPVTRGPDVPPPLP